MSLMARKCPLPRLLPPNRDSSYFGILIPS